jgi:hypothetical protein
MVCLEAMWLLAVVSWERICVRQPRRQQPQLHQMRLIQKISVNEHSLRQYQSSSSNVNDWSPIPKAD